MIEVIKPYLLLWFARQQLLTLWGVLVWAKYLKRRVDRT